MDSVDGLVCAFILDGKGGGRAVGWPEVRAWRPEDGVLWIHLDRMGTEAVRWVSEESGIDPVIQDTLMAAESRPRALARGEVLFVILRGVNLNPGADPEDMVAIRAWIDSGRVVTIRHRRLMAVNDLRDALTAGRGPDGPGDLLVQMCDRLIRRMGPIIAELDEQVDGLEDDVVTARDANIRVALGDTRRTAIALRRYLAPQRDVVAGLAGERVSWLSDRERSQLREIADRTTRYVEDLDAVRERAAVIQDELNSRTSERMNRTMYLLTLVSSILLPPSLLVGLLGVNVGGIPGIDTEWAFAAVVLSVTGLGVAEFLLLRHLRWI